MIFEDLPDIEIPYVKPKSRLIRVPNDGQKRVAFTRKELEEVTDYFFDLGINGHMRQHLDPIDPHDYSKSWDEDMRETRLNELFEGEKK